MIGVKDIGVLKEGMVITDDFYNDLKHRYDLPDNATEITIKLLPLATVKVDYKYFDGKKMIEGCGTLYYNEDIYDKLKEMCTYPLEKQPTSLMKFDPTTGEQHPYPSCALQYRKYHGKVAWLYNPYTGTKRSVMDIGSDTFGQLIIE